MKAIILAAGRGSRMLELTNDKPKCLTKIDEKPLLEWQLLALQRAGISEIGIVTGYKREMLSHYQLHEFHNKHWQTTNMVASLFSANEWLSKDTCIVSYSDIFYRSSAISSLKNTTAEFAITYDPNWRTLWEARFTDILSDAETFKLNTDHTLSEIGNRPHSIDDIQGQYMGLLRFTPKSWKVAADLYHSLSPDEQSSIHVTGLLQKLMTDYKTSITAIPYNDTWGEIDSQTDLSYYKTQTLALE